MEPIQFRCCKNAKSPQLQLGKAPAGGFDASPKKKKKDKESEQIYLISGCGTASASAKEANFFSVSWLLPISSSSSVVLRPALKLLWLYMPVEGHFTDVKPRLRRFQKLLHLLERSEVTESQQLHLSIQTE